MMTLWQNMLLLLSITLTTPSWHGNAVAGQVLHAYAETLSAEITATADSEWLEARLAMMATVKKYRAVVERIRDPYVIAAMHNVPRHLFVPPGVREYAPSAVTLSQHWPR